MGEVSSVTVINGSVALGSTVSVGDVVGKATRVSVRDEAYVATASVRNASVFSFPVCSVGVVLNENIKISKMPMIRMVKILVFIC